LPVAPVVPVAPVLPVAPVAPVLPVAPGGPVGPGGPVEPFPLIISSGHISFITSQDVSVWGVFKILFLCSFDNCNKSKMIINILFIYLYILLILIF
jgi:hypothetical protein